MDKDEKSRNKSPIYKKWWFWVIIAVVILGVIGASGNTSQAPNNPETESQPSSADTELSSEADTASEKEDVSDMDIHRIIMVDTVSKWDDVDEFSLRVDENAAKKYDGKYTVTISANYNGPEAGSADKVLNYCNTIATTLDSAKSSVGEFEITWTMPAVSNDPVGKCHYHNQRGILIYDNESTGILENK